MSSTRTSTTSYSQRTVDMLLLSVVERPVPDTTVTPDAATDPRIASGIEKMVQRFALLLLTKSGTVENCADEGTDLLSALESGRIYDENSLLSIANAAVKYVLRQMKAEDAAGTYAPDEKIAAAEITDVALSRATASVSLTVKLTSASGETYTYVTPLSTGL